MSHDLYLLKLASSGITEDAARRHGILYATPEDPDLRSLLPTHSSLVPALRLDYFDLDGTPRDGVYRMRLLAPLVSTAQGFGRGAEILRDGKTIRYLQPEGTVPAAYLPRGVPWRTIAGDAGKSIMITEGELKSVSACERGFWCLALGGVWNWKSRRLAWSFLPELDQIHWVQREVILVFDSDYVHKPNVSLALVQFTAQLRSRGARVKIVTLPSADDGSKQGLDDFLVARGTADLGRLVQEAPADELAERLHELNSRLVFVDAADAIYDESRALVVNPHRCSTSTFADLHVMCPDASGKQHKKLLIKEWISWPSRRRAVAFTCDPGADRMVDGKYNLWRGWGCEEHEGDIKPWLDLLQHIFPDDERVAREWFLRWLAYPIQNPGAKLASAVLVWSTETGVGKSLLGYTMRHLYGDGWRMLNQAEFESGFTSWAERKQFILVDDIAAINRRESKDTAAVMKTRITQHEITINIKFVAHYTIPDRINYYLTSNYPDAIHLDPNDRRYLVHQARGGKLPPKIRAAFARWRDGDGPVDGGRGAGPGALLYYLRHGVDLAGFDAYTEPPVTESKAAMSAVSRSDLEAWCLRLVDDPDSALRLDEAPVPGDLFTNSQLRAICERRTGSRFVTSQGLGVALGAAGLRRRVVKVRGLSHGLWAVRNADRWWDRPPTDWARHYAQHHGGES